MDRLRLAEHERQLPAFGHRRLQPLQSRGGRCGGIGNAHGLRLADRGDGQLAAEHLVGRRQRKRQLAGTAVCGNRLDLADVQLARIQHQRIGIGLLPVQGIGGGTADLPGIEIQLQVQRQIGDHHLFRLRIGAFVVAACRTHGCLAAGSGRRGRCAGRFTAAGSAQHQGNGQRQDQGRRTHGSTQLVENPKCSVPCRAK